MSVTVKPRPWRPVDPDETAAAPEVLIAEAKARARRRRRFIAGLALVALAGSLLSAGLARRGDVTDGEPAIKPAPVVLEWTGVPWCVTVPGGGEVVVGAGPPVTVPCRFGGQGGRVHLLHHAGSTLLSLRGAVYRVRDGHLTPLGDARSEIRMSHDGRHAAWLTNVANSNCGALGLEVRGRHGHQGRADARRGRGLRAR